MSNQFLKPLPSRTIPIFVVSQLRCRVLPSLFREIKVVFQYAGLSYRAQDVVLSKNKALSFYKRFIDDNIDEECYGEESCDYEEVVEKFGHSEQSVCMPCAM